MVFQCINIRQVPREVLKTAAFSLGFQHLPRDQANVNAWKTMFDPYNDSSNTACLHRQRKWTVLFCIKSLGGSAQHEELSFHDVFKIFYDIICHFLDVRLCNVVNLHQIDVNASWWDFVEQWCNVGRIWRNQLHFCRFLKQRTCQHLAPLVKFSADHILITFFMFSLGVACISWSSHWSLSFWRLLGRLTWSWTFCSQSSTSFYMYCVLSVVQGLCES